MNENKDSLPQPCCQRTPEEVSRRSFLQNLCLGLGALCAAILGAPAVGFVVAPLFHKPKETWIKVGKTTDFEPGKTVSVPFPDPSPMPWAGVTAKSAAWLRRDINGEFTAFSVNCTHLGCPVLWLPDAEIFMCPCHGGVYYKDGAVAGGPPPKPLVRFDVRVVNEIVEIKSAAIPITTTL